MSQVTRNLSEAGDLIQGANKENEVSENGELRQNRKRKVDRRVFGDISLTAGSQNEEEEHPAKIAKTESASAIAMPLVPLEGYLTSIDEFANTLTEVPMEIEEKRFHELDDKTITDVMAYLPTSALLALSQSSIRFNNILKENPNRLPLPLTLNFDTNEFPTFERRYRMVKIENLETPDTAEREVKVMNVLKKLGIDFHDVTFVHCVMSQDFLARVLGLMQNITSLTVQKTQLKMSAISELPWLPKLKKVAITNNYENLSPVLSNVTTLEHFSFLIPKKATIEESDDYETDDNDSEESEDENSEQLYIPEDHGRVGYANVKALLMRQSNLQILDLNSGKFFNDSFNELPFQLKKIILFIPMATIVQLRHMHSFLQTQNSLETCVFNVLSYLSGALKLNESFGFVMGLRSLKDLKIVFYNTVEMNEFYRDFQQVNPSVKKLFLHLRRFDRNYRRFMERTIHHFPNVQELCLKLDDEWCHNATARVFEPISQMKYLEDLTIDNFPSAALTMLTIPTLKRITIISMRESVLDDWRQFFQNNKLMEEVYAQIIETIESLVDGTNAPVSALINEATLLLKKIKTFSICTPRNISIMAKDIDEITQSMARVEAMSYIKLCRYEFFKYNMSNDKSVVYLQVDKGQRELHSTFSTIYVL